MSHDVTDVTIVTCLRTVFSVKEGHVFCKILLIHNKCSLLSKWKFIDLILLAQSSGKLPNYQFLGMSPDLNQCSLFEMFHHKGMVAGDAEPIIVIPTSMAMVNFTVNR